MKIYLIPFHIEEWTFFVSGAMYARAPGVAVSFWAVATLDWVLAHDKKEGVKRCLLACYLTLQSGYTINISLFINVCSIIMQPHESNVDHIIII